MTRPPRVSTEELWASYQELESLAAVAERHGYPHMSAVWQRFKRAGLPMHPRGPTLDTRNIVPIAEVLEAFEKTGRYAETARLVGSTPHAVKHRIVKYRKEHQR